MGRLVAAIGAAVLVVACGGEGDAPGPLVPPGANVSRLGITAVDASGGQARYRAPRTVRGGLVEIRFVNRSSAPRKAQLWRVGAGHTVEQALRTRRRLPPWLTWAGGVGLTAPRRTGVAVQRLPPGTYFVTGIRSERRGVARLRVTAAAGSAARPAPASARVAALDYGFEVTGLRPGPASLEFRNAGKEPHHAFFAPLQEGRTLAEARDFFAGKLAGPPPVDPERTRESVVLEGRQSQVTRLNLQSRRYALVCFVRDRAGGPPHTEKGMVTEVRVP